MLLLWQISFILLKIIKKKHIILVLNPVYERKQIEAKEKLPFSSYNNHQSQYHQNDKNNS